MLIFMFSDTAIGYSIIMGAVILVVLIYTIIRLRKQVKKTKNREKQKRRDNT